ncbi:hypothetical protein QJQ45_026724, partial [Haematococcus lacustris]
EDENERECVAAACRVFQLSLTASSLALDLQRLELACAFLLTDRLWAVAMADLAQLALFVTYVVEATAGTEHNLAWWMAAVKAGNAYLPNLVTPLQRAQPMNAKMLAGAASQYVQEPTPTPGCLVLVGAAAGGGRVGGAAGHGRPHAQEVPLQVVSSLMQALVAAGEARCLRLHQQLGAACNVTSQGNGVTAAETPPVGAAGSSSPAAAAATEPGLGQGAGAAAEPVLSQPTAAPQHMGGMPDAAATQAVNQSTSPEPGATSAGAAAGAGGQGLDPVAPHLAAAGQVRLKGPGSEPSRSKPSMVAKACEAVLTKVNALLGTPSNPPAATQQQTRHGQTMAQAAAAATAAAQESRKGSEALETARE